MKYHTSYFHRVVIPNIIDYTYHLKSLNSFSSFSATISSRYNLMFNFIIDVTLSKVEVGSILLFNRTLLLNYYVTNSSCCETFCTHPHLSHNYVKNYAS